MAEVKSNLADIRAVLKGLTGILDLSRPTRDGRRLGDQAVAIVATGIRDRTVNQQLDPTGKPLAPLKARTLARKRKKGYPDTIGVQTGDMLAIKELEGLVGISPERVVMIYGDNEEDRKKAEWFTEGKPGVQKARPFYDIDEEIEEKLTDLFVVAAEQGIVDLGGG